MIYKLPKGWKILELRDIGKIITGKTPSTKNSNYFDGDVAFLTPSDDMESRFVGKTKRTLSKEGVQTVKNRLLPKSSICVSCIGSQLGKVVITSNNTITNQQINSIILDDRNDYMYVYYYMILLGKKLRYISKTSTAVPIINKTEFSKEKIILPTLREQKSIASILSVLDDKIENNNKIAKNLEAQAQAIFKHWFVDFEFPNEEGKPYKSSGGEMEESELGMIPKGWEIVKLKDELEFLRGVEPGSKNYLDKKEDDNLPFYRVGEMISETNIYVKEDLLKDRIANKDDILVSFDGTVGRVRIGISGGYSTGIRKIFSKGKYFPKTFIYYLFKSKNIQDIIKQHATGTTILHASKSIDYMYIPYNKNIIKKFDGIFNKVFRKLINIQEENKKLEELRDTLLPKLISGDLRIPLD